MGNIKYSFLLPCRLTQEYPNVLEEMLASFVRYCKEDIDKTEFIIRLDRDDYFTLQQVDFLTMKYRLIVKTLSSGSWEGRKSINLFYQQLFPLIDNNSEFIGFLSDDMVLTGDILSNLKKYEGQNKCLMFFQTTHSIFPKERYEKLEELSFAGWTEPYPIVSKKLLPYINFSYMNNIDSYLSLLNLILQQKFMSNIVCVIPEWTQRRGERIIRQDWNVDNNYKKILDIPLFILNNLEITAKGIYVD